MALLRFCPAAEAAGARRPCLNRAGDQRFGPLAGRLAATARCGSPYKVRGPGRCKAGELRPDSDRGRRGARAQLGRAGRPSCPREAECARARCPPPRTGNAVRVGLAEYLHRPRPNKLQRGNWGRPEALVVSFLTVLRARFGGTTSGQGGAKRPKNREKRGRAPQSEGILRNTQEYYYVRNSRVGAVRDEFIQFTEAIINLSRNPRNQCIGIPGARRRTLYLFRRHSCHG